MQAFINNKISFRVFINIIIIIINIIIIKEALAPRFFIIKQWSAEKLWMPGGGGYNSGSPLLNRRNRVSVPRYHSLNCRLQKTSVT